MYKEREQARAYDDEFKEIGVFGRKRGAHCDGVWERKSGGGGGDGGGVYLLQPYPTVNNKLKERKRMSLIKVTCVFIYLDFGDFRANC